MRSGRWAGAMVVVVAAAFPAPGRAQTSDIVFGGWSWRSRDVGSRPAGLGGAYVAVADSIRTATVNPAGIALIPRAELALGTANLWAGVGFSLRRSAKKSDAGRDPRRPPRPSRWRSGRPSPARAWSCRARRLA